MSHKAIYDSQDARDLTEAVAKLKLYDDMVESMRRVSVEADYVDGLSWKCVKQLRKVLDQIVMVPYAKS